MLAWRLRVAPVPLRAFHAARPRSSSSFSWRFTKRRHHFRRSPGYLRLRRDGLVVIASRHSLETVWSRCPFAPASLTLLWAFQGGSNARRRF